MTQPVRAPGALDDPTTLAAMVDRLGAAFHVSDADGRLIDATPGLAALLGVSDDGALRGRPLDDWIADPSARRAALQALAPDAPARTVLLTLRGAGRATHAVETVTAVRGPDGAVRLQGMLVAASGIMGASQGGASLSTSGEAGRDALTGSLDRTHLNALGERLGRDPVTPVGVLIARLEGEDIPAEDRDVMRQLVARFLMRQVRANEEVIRLGDDEFLVVLGGASAEQVERVGRRVQLLALRSAPGPLSLGWAARDRGESLPALVARAAAQRVPVPTRERDAHEHRRAGEEPVGAGGWQGFGSGTR
ncbi:sensor domain-containing diguanylate cyclase [Roseisolibacter agri]|uniref:GGDEF domain-containing protein n=1 Tax=Roseisolibacter agri TaxID=2014610 RepID=A0AA37V032_9BACT|nr:PAS domain-containing protein [Roseisolibacter agri]GLC23605.1 hypothetical protein rosag_01180 [Roseisolibacter agri]